MSEQYFAKDPQSESRPRRFEARALGVACAFDTDAGVFSKGELDEGTRLLLESLPPMRGRALDLGCGWGAVGVFLAKKYPDASFVLSDVNTRACALSRGNIAANRLENARVLESDAFSAIDGVFDCIVTNPPIRAGKRVIYAMFSGAARFLAPGGRLFVVIRKQQGASSALAYLKTVYESAETIARDKGFWVIECRKG